MIDGTFWISMAGIMAAFLGGVLTALNKSKCQNLSCCWGGMQCVRDVRSEVELEERRMELHMPSPS